MSRLIKVTLEYEDHIDTLEGDDARKWESDANGAITFNYAHGIKFPEFPWKTAKKKITAHARK